MGIPAYFRWISERYPKMMKDCVEFVSYDENTGTERRIDATKANPNGIEFDNLYLDMNGIIHPCTHPEDGPAPTTEKEMFDAVCNYIDRIFAIVRPRRLLYMAIDGVAPRAKINQQRSRRFRSAREAEQKLKEKNQLREEWRKIGFKVKEQDANAPPPFDSNVITPGTPFMARLAVELRKFVANRITNDPAWKNIRVLFSDASVPGEGEHKIAEFIRVERGQPGYNPNIHHVMYGLDADLIMLALSTHELRFSILREEVFPKRGELRNGQGRGPGGSAAGTSTPGQQQQRSYGYQQEYIPQRDKLEKRFVDEMERSGFKLRDDIGNRKPFHFLHVNVLREYLDAEFRDDINFEIGLVPDSQLAYDLERVIDDFVFLCFFVGNDFLPHLPTLDIREGAVNFLIELYKQQLPTVGYLTSDGGNVDFSRVRKMLIPIGLKEDEIFKERAAKEASLRERQDREREAREEAKKRNSASGAAIGGGATGLSPAAPGTTGAATSTGTAGPALIVPMTRMMVKPAAGSPPILDKRGRRIAPSIPPVGEPLVALRGNRQMKVGSGEKKASAEEKLRRTLAKKSEKVISPRLKRPTPDTIEINKKKRPKVSASSEVKSPLTETPATPILDVPIVEEKTEAEFKEALHQRMRDKSLIKQPFDNVELGKDGWKDRYYKNKFHWNNDAEGARGKKDLLQSYFEGLYWVMKYYYEGCVSWGWYYPYHYAPFASDLVESDVLTDDINFELGEPYKPFSQLQSVMPASSGKLVLPTCYSDLMTDPKSPIIDYYPTDFKLDLNGKRFEWQGVALLPFIDEKRLRAALDGLDKYLTDEEKKRNSFGECHIVCSTSSNLGQLVSSVKEGMKCAVTDNVAGGLFFGSVSGAVEGTTNGAVFSVFHLPKNLPHSSSLISTAVALPDELHDGHRSMMRHGGWKQAKFGILGRAAKEIQDSRMQRANGGRYRRGMGRSRGGGRGMGRGMPHPAGSAMFPMAQPAWGRGGGGGYQQPRMPNYGGYEQQPRSQQQQPQQPYQHAYGGGGGGGGYQPQQQRQPYNAYQQQAPYGYYNHNQRTHQQSHQQQYGRSQQHQQRQQYGGQQHQQQYGGQQRQHDYYQHQHQQNGGYQPPEQPRWAMNPAAYGGGGQHYNQGMYRGGGGGGGGLSGPTAASFRRGRGRGQRGGPRR